MGTTPVVCKSVPTDGPFAEYQLSPEEGKVIFRNHVLVQVNAAKALGSGKEKGGYNGSYFHYSMKKKHMSETVHKPI